MFPDKWYNSVLRASGLLAGSIGLLLVFPAIDSALLQLLFKLSGKELSGFFFISGLRHFGIELIIGALLLLAGSLIKNRNAFYFLAIVVVAVAFFIFLQVHCVNVPINDDFATILRFSNRYFFAGSAAEKLSLLTAFHAECRLITTRVIIITLHFFTGAVNIKWLLLVANCCLPLIIAICCKAMPELRFRATVTLMMALLVFQFGYYDAIVWATDALHYQFTILFLVLCLHLLTKKEAGYQAAALLAALLAAITFGNGLLVLPIAILYFLLHGRMQTALIWATVAAVLFGLYFYGFNAGGTGVEIHNPLQYIIYSCCFLGGAFQFMYQMYLPFAAGLFIWGLFVFLTVKRYYLKNYFVYGLFLFVILSSLAAAQFRLNFGVAEAISNRYGIFSVLAISAVLMALADILPARFERGFIAAGLCCTVLYHLLSGIFFFPEVPIRKQKLEAFIQDIKADRPFVAVDPIIPAGADAVTREAMYKKIYRP